MAMQGQAKTWRMTPAELGMNAVTLAADRTSNTILAEGYSQLTVYFNFTRDAATAVNLIVESSYDDGTTWAQEQFGSISGGTDTLTAGVHQIATTASKIGFFYVPIAARHLRLKTSDTAGGASDLLTVSILLTTNPN